MKMTAREAGAVCLAYQRCAWALEELGLAQESAEMQRRADHYRERAEEIWANTK